jgi:hypothetical protein
VYVLTCGREGACLRSLDGPKESAWSTLEPRSTNPAITVADLKTVRIMMFPLDLFVGFRLEIGVLERKPPGKLCGGRARTSRMTLG